MSKTIFYSWQSDLPSNINRSFIEDALNKAVKKINSEILVEEAERDEDIVLDKDTMGVTGIPPIADTILDKISKCSVFVPDLSFVGKTSQERFLPNPNVLIEYGYALKVVTPTCMVPVMNTAFGKITKENLPFNMRHRRNPITYDLKEDASPEDRKNIKKDLVLELVAAIKPILESEIEKIKGSLIKTQPFAGTKPTLGPSIFWAQEEDFLEPGTHESSRIAGELSRGEHLFLHVIPNIESTQIKTAMDAVDLIRSGKLIQMCRQIMGSSYRRNKYGAYVYEMEDNTIRNFTQLFLTGELWGIDAYMINKESMRKGRDTPVGYLPSAAVENVFNFTLDNYLLFMNKVLGAQLPLRYRVGATNVYGYQMGTKDRYNRLQGSVVNDNIVFEGEITSFDSKPADILRPFFEHLYEECGLDRSNFETS